MRKKLAVIGGGASGLLTSILLARKSAGAAEIVIFERLDRVGKKLLATGNGSCNLTNIFAGIENFHSLDQKASLSSVESIIKRFDSSAAMRFFEELGVVCTVEANGRVYPASYQASSVLDLLRIECSRLGIIEKTAHNVLSIKKSTESNQFAIEIEGHPTEIADCVLIATGGEASANLGSNGSSFPIMASFGHSSTARFPAIVPIETDTSEIRSLTGIKFHGSASAWQGDFSNDSVCLRSESGEILFTNYGLSGPPILQLSAAVGESLLRSKQPVYIVLNLCPDISKDTLLHSLKQRRDSQGHKTLADFFTGWLNKRIGQAIIKASGLGPLSKLSLNLADNELLILAKFMQAWPVKVRKNRNFSQAQVTAGGIALSEFTAGLESRFVPGLFAAGEILDVHGDCGGYNLQWAWSSAHTASSAMLKHLRSP